MTEQAGIPQEKIQWVIDIEEIKMLMSKYCHGIDKQDEETFMSIWAEDADYVLPRGEGHGIDGIRALVHKVWEQVPKCHHHITNPVIDVHGDTATAKTDVFYFRLTDDGVNQLLSGGYALEFVRRDGGWKTRRMEFSPFVSTSPILATNPQVATTARVRTDCDRAGRHRLRGGERRLTRRRRHVRRREDVLADPALSTGNGGCVC